MSILNRRDYPNNKQSKFIMTCSLKDVETLKAQGFQLLNQTKVGKKETFLFMNNPLKINFIDVSNMNLMFTNKLMFG